MVCVNSQYHARNFSSLSAMLKSSKCISIIVLLEFSCKTLLQRSIDGLLNQHPCSVVVWLHIQQLYCGVVR